MSRIFKEIVMLISMVGALLIMRVPAEPIWRPIMGMTILCLAFHYYLKERV